MENEVKSENNLPFFTYFIWCFGWFIYYQGRVALHIHIQITSGTRIRAYKQMHEFHTLCIST